MKKFFGSLVMLLILLTSTAAFAAYTETVEEDADIASIKRLAIDLPEYYKVEEAEPTIETFTENFYTVSKAARCYVISYEEIVNNIKKDTGVDITALNYMERKKAYRANVGKYADAFVVATVANNSSKPQFFFEVRNAKDSSMLYVLSSQSSDIGKNEKDYMKACEDFYKKFDAAAEKNLKDSKKKDKKKDKE